MSYFLSTPLIEDIAHNFQFLEPVTLTLQPERGELDLLSIRKAINDSTSQKIPKGMTPSMFVKGLTTNAAVQIDGMVVDPSQLTWFPISEPIFTRIAFYNTEPITLTYTPVYERLSSAVIDMPHLMDVYIPYGPGRWWHFEYHVGHSHLVTSEDQPVSSFQICNKTVNVIRYDPALEILRMSEDDHARIAEDISPFLVESPKFHASAQLPARYYTTQGEKHEEVLALLLDKGIFSFNLAPVAWRELDPESAENTSKREWEEMQSYRLKIEI